MKKHPKTYSYQVLVSFIPPKVARTTLKWFHQVLPSDLFWVLDSWPFQRWKRDLHVGDQKVTWKLVNGKYMKIYCSSYISLSIYITVSIKHINTLNFPKKSDFTNLKISQRVKYMFFPHRNRTWGNQLLFETCWDRHFPRKKLRFNRRNEMKCPSQPRHKRRWSPKASKWWAKVSNEKRGAANCLGYYI